MLSLAPLTKCPKTACYHEFHTGSCLFIIATENGCISDAYFVRLQEIYHRHISDLELRDGPIQVADSEKNRVTESKVNDNSTANSSFSRNITGDKRVAKSRDITPPADVHSEQQAGLEHDMETAMLGTHTGQTNHDRLQLRKLKTSRAFSGSRRKAGGAKGIAKARPVASGTVSTSARGKRLTEVDPAASLV